MSQQLTITNFFKSNIHSPKIEMLKGKKRNLSLSKASTPSKSPRNKIDIKHIPQVNLLSDDDDDFEPPKKLNLSQCSNNSDKTVIYSLSPRSPLKTPQKTPQKTPRKSLQNTPSSPIVGSTLKVHTPGSKDKFFSPTKKRSVKKKAPKITVRRNLGNELEELTGNGSVIIEDNAKIAFEDDKTKFLGTIINKYLCDATLKPLLDSKEHTLLCSCMYSDIQGLKLICRLFWRKEGWYKKKQVLQIISEDKSLIDDPTFEEMMQYLGEHKLIVQGNDSMSFDELASILNADELKNICKVLFKGKNLSKQKSIDLLKSFSKRKSNISNYFTSNKTTDNSRRVLQIMRDTAGQCYKMTDLARRTLSKLHLLMYLGMDYTIIREKKLELVLINDKIKREPYPVDKNMILDNASVVFNTKEEFERYFSAHNLYEDFMNETSSEEKSNLVLQAYCAFKAISAEEMARYESHPNWLRRFTPANLYIRILDAGIQELKKEKCDQHYELALEILTRLIGQNAFRQHKKADWYAEKALILHSSLGKCDEAAEVLIEGFKSNMSDEEKDAMRRRANKIAKQKNMRVSEHLRTELLDYATKDTILEKNLSAEHIYKQPMEKTSNKGKSKFETRTSEGRIVQDVEEYCITHYINSGLYTHGEHWEGRIITTMFFLLFWDIIYSKPVDVRGVFLSYFQVYPLDMFSGSFYKNRKTRIDERLKYIEEGSTEQIVNMMEDTWNSRPESEISGINRSIGWDNVSAVAGCLPPRALAALCRRLAVNYRYTHSGFPDLTLWNVYTKQIKFIEVKTDCDHPSMKQIQWMNYLKENGIDTGFTYVGVNTMRQKSRAGIAS